MNAQKIIFSFLILLLSVYEVLAQCSLANEVPITDLGTQYGYIRIESAVIDDLGSAGQGICGIRIRFRHASVGDINLNLSAPNGRIYPLIRAGGSRSTRGTEWDIRFVPCTETAMPDQGNFIKPVWDSDQDWGENNTYNGSYHAETCLDNIRTGPVNGIWTLSVSDVTGTGAGIIEDFSIEFCDTRGISCSECFRSGGVINRDTTQVCGGDPSLGAIRVFPTYSGVEPDPDLYTYRFVVVKSGIIREISQLPDLQSAEAGDYLVYGISVAKQDLATLITYDGQAFSSLTNALAINRLGFCAAFSSGYKVYRILSDPDPRTVVNAYVCPESPIIFNGNTITTPGVYTATLISAAGCDSIVELRVQDFVVRNQIVNPGTISCANKPLTLAWQNNQFSTSPALHWFTRDGSILSGERSAMAQIDLPGTYQLAINQGGCGDTLSININSDGSLPELLIEDIVMNCSANIGMLRPVSDGTSFSWSGPFGYASTDQNIDVTEPGEYIITAVGANCAVRKRVQVGADFDRPQNIMASGGSIRCANDSVQLSASSTTTGVAFQWSGPNSFSSVEQNPRVSESGIYSVRVGAGGCTEMRQVEVHNLFASPTISITGATLDCRAASKRITTTVSDPVALFQWSGPNSFSSSERSPLIRDAGLYQVIVTDVNGCLYESSATVNIDTVKPTVSAMDINLNCPQDNFILGANHSSLHTPVFRWTGPGNFVSTDLNAVATQTGIYTLVVTDPINGCSARTTLEAIPDPQQPVLMTKHGNINCDRPRDTLIVDANCGGGCNFEWNGPGGFTDVNDSVIVKDAGNYNVKVTDISSGCYSWAGFLVQKDTLPLKRDVRIVPIGCTTEGMITLDNTNQIRQFEWIDTLSRDIFSTPSISTLVPRVLSLESIDINGCMDQEVFKIEVQDDAPVVAIRTDSIDCARDSVVLGVSLSNYASSQIAGFQWQFADGSTSSRANPRVGAPGPVMVEILLRNGCEGGAQGIVDTDYVTPLVDAQGGGFACRDSGVWLDFTADRPALSTYWTGPNGFESYIPNPLARSPGVYTLEILGYNGCPALDTAIVYYTDPLPSLIAFGDTVTCLDTAGNISFDTDAPAGYSFRWLDPGGRINNNSSIVTTLVGPYQIELTDQNGCRAVARAEIEIDTISWGHTIEGGIISCLEPTTQLLLDTVYDFLQYSWSFDSMTIANVAQPVVDTGGLFILTTTNINGCRRNITYQVEADTVSPDYILSDDTLNCENSRITLRPFPSLGAWSYLWAGPGDFSFDRATPLITGPGRYTLTATASNGCSRTLSSNIEADFEIPEILIDSTFIPCNNDSASLSFITLDSLKETNWFGPNGYYRPTVAAATDSEGWYYLLAKGYNGCEAFDSQFVSAIPLLEPLSISNQKIDCSHSTGFVNIDSINPDYRYLMINEQGDTSFNFTSQTTVQQTFQIVAEHLASGCTIEDTVFIPADTFPPLLQIIEMDSIICEHREIRLGSEVDAPVVYQWSTQDGRFIGPLTNNIARLDQPGTYTLEVRSISNDCISNQTITIDEKLNNLSRIYLSGSDASCDGANDAIVVVDSIEGGTGPFTFSINDEYYTSQNIFPFLEPNRYRLYIKDVNGCRIDTFITVDRYPTFELSLGDEEILTNLGDSLVLDAFTTLDPGAIADITWLLPDSLSCTDCLQQTILPTGNRYYYVSMTSQYGCIRRDTVYVRVADPDRIFVPNAFTPNNDDVNDFLEVFTGNEIEQISIFEIFDRWGNSVFLASDFAPGDLDARWDGTYRGEELNPGVYVYLLKAIDIRGTVKTKVGDVTLLR